jgi:hypothetical protein
MTQVLGSTGAAPVLALPLAAPGATQAASGLLPAPSAQLDVGDAITQLLQMSSQLSEQQLALGKGQVEVATDRRKDAAAKRKAALDHAIEAARKAREAKSDGGFFGFVTDHLGATGLLGLATFNWGLVAADMITHAASPAQEGTGVFDLGIAAFGGPLAYLAEQGAKKLAPDAVDGAAVGATILGGPLGYALERAAEKMGPADLVKHADELTTIKDDDVRLANKVALAVALAAVAATATVVTGGTSAPALIALVGIGVSTTTQVAAETGALQAVFGEKAAMYVAMGGAVTGAVLTLGGSIASAVSATSALKLAEEVKTVARLSGAAISITEGTSSVVTGIEDLRSAGYQHESDLAKVDAEAQRQVLKRIERLVDTILDDLKAAHESAQRATETLQATLQTHDQTVLQAGSMKV